MIGNKQINKEEDFNVFLDSNIYIRYNFNMYSNMHMKRLKDFINDNINVKLYSNKIVEKECLSAINSKAKDTFKDIHALRNKMKWDMLSSTKLKDNLEEIQIEDENELVEVSKENFYKFLNDFNVINIPIDTVDTEIIFENYFNSIPPFEEKKKKEFPDAFIIESIKMFQKSNSYMKMYIVSQDKGFLKAFENNEHYICYEKIEDLLDVLNHKFYLPNYEKAIEIIKSEGNNIKDSIIDHIVESSSILVYYEYLEYYDVEVTSINEIIVSKPMINDIETNIISFTLPCSIELNTLNSYYDYDNSIWDQEEKSIIT